MTCAWLKRGLLMWLSVLNASVALAQWSDDLQVSQSLPDMAPLMKALRNVNEPESMGGSTRKLNEQATRELANLKTTALSVPGDPSGRAAAGQSACLLGLLYLHGAAVNPDSARARQWFSLCAHYRDPLASAGLAWCALDGCQSAPNLSQAQIWVRRLNRVEPARAAHFQWLIDVQLRPLNPKATEGLQTLSTPERNLLVKAVAGGNVHAMIELGILHAQSHDLARALQLFDQASGQSRVAAENAAWVRQRIAAEHAASAMPSVTSQAILAAPPTPVQEFTIESKPMVMATPEQAQATYLAARRFHRGDGVALNYAEAIRLYRQADAQGSGHAKRMLSLIYSRTTPEGGLDAVWMRQLADLDVNAPVPKQDVALGASALRREPTPLIDLLPTKWRQWMD